MHSIPSESASPRRSVWRILGWSAAIALFLAPLIAMQFTEEVRWTGRDFLFAGLLIGGIGIAFEVAARQAPNRLYLAGFGVILTATFFMVWINTAVGILGSAANDANGLYYLILALGVFLGSACGWQPDAMAWASAATGVAQMLLLAVALVMGLGQPADSPSQVVAINGMFIVLWLSGAWLFRASARKEAARSRTP